MNDPTISIVVPVRDRTDLLLRALRSVLDQGFEDFELIVVDDGSVRPVEESVASLQDPRIRFVRQPPAGANPARNRGASMARGRYLTFLDSDDEALPGWLRCVAAALEGGAGIVCGGYERVRPDGRVDVILPSRLPLVNVKGTFSHAGTFAVRRELFEAVGGYAEHLRAGQHTELSFRLVPRALEMGLRIEAPPEPLIRYHVGTRGGIRRDDAAVLSGVEYILEAHYELLRGRPRRLASSYATAGVRAFRLDRRQTARSYLVKAVRVHPLRVKHWGRLLVSLVPGLGGRLWGRHRSADVDPAGQGA